MCEISINFRCRSPLSRISVETEKCEIRKNLIFWKGFLGFIYEDRTQNYDPVGVIHEEFRVHGTLLLCHRRFIAMCGL